MNNKRIVYFTIGLILTAVSCNREDRPQADSVKDEKKEEAKQELAILPVDLIAEFQQFDEAVLWIKYDSAKQLVDAAVLNDEHDSLMDALHLAAMYAMALQRTDIAAWQLNNIGYYSIEEFQKRTNYGKRMRQIETMPHDSSKIRYIEETRFILRSEMALLKNATRFLEKAYELNSNLDDPDRTQKIYSNLKFIDWIRNFIDKR